MFCRYPNKLRYTLPESGGVYDPNTGQWTPVVEGAPVEIECRAFPNGKGRTMQKENGTHVEYAYDIGIPLGVIPPPVNEPVTVIGINGEILHSGVYMRSHVGCFSIRGWVE